MPHSQTACHGYNARADLYTVALDTPAMLFAVLANTNARVGFFVPVELAGLKNFYDIDIKTKM
ncbi:MAG: hypothetical protein HC896_10565 [Bacteroidales bacterium]|nr:hypothetical protein [Bacteroidales bacterium]